MNLFELDSNYSLQISPEAYSLSVFAKLWNRDRTKGKNKAKQELAYVYFMSDYKSDYADIVNEEERSKEIIKGLGIKDSWIPDNKVEEAIGFYKERRETIASKLLDDAKTALYKISEFLGNVDLTEIDQQGKLRYDPTKIGNLIKNIPQLTKALDEAEKEVKKQLQASSKARGSMEKSMFEDG